MKSFIIYCPHLNRDIRPILEAIPNPRIHTGTPTASGADGCLQCHQEIVAHARMRQDRYIFVMEDDCGFTNHFDLREWEADIRWAEERGYDVVVGGCTRTSDERLVLANGNRRLIQVSEFCSAHCIAYLASSYDKILQTTQPFDISVGRVGCRVLLTWPFIAVQRPSFSGILRRYVDYVPLYTAHEKRLGHALGMLEPMIEMPAY